MLSMSRTLSGMYEKEEVDGKIFLLKFLLDIKRLFTGAEVVILLVAE